MACQSVGFQLGATSATQCCCKEIAGRSKACAFDTLLHCSWQAVESTAAALRFLLQLR
jgi:hypothetical protein